MITNVLNKLRRMSTVPRPFPGKHATRILITSGDPKVPFIYAGKICPTVLENIRQNYFLKGGLVEYLDYQEFDQNGIVLNSRQGRVQTMVTFVPLYVPFTRQVTEGFWCGTWLYYLLNRQPITVDGRATTGIGLLEGSKYEEAEQQMVLDCARGRIDRPWFEQDFLYEVSAIINDRAFEWFVVRGRQKVPAPTEIPKTAVGYKLAFKVPVWKARLPIAEEGQAPRAKRPTVRELYAQVEVNQPGRLLETAMVGNLGQAQGLGNDQGLARYYWDRQPPQQVPPLDDLWGETVHPLREPDQF